MGLDGGVLRKHVPGLGRCGQPEIARRDGVDAERSEQLAHLVELAGIVRGDHDLAGQGTVEGTGSQALPIADYIRLPLLQVDELHHAGPGE